jgi:hypothetical protein
MKVTDTNTIDFIAARRSAAAKKAWETRRANLRQVDVRPEAARSARARKAWATRRQRRAAEKAWDTMRNRTLIEQLKAADQRVEVAVRHLMEASKKRRAAAEKLVADGWSLTEIADAIGRSKSAVAHMLAARGSERR